MITCLYQGIRSGSLMLECDAVSSKLRFPLMESLLALAFSWEDPDSRSVVPWKVISVIDDIWPKGKSQGMGLECGDGASG